MRSSRSRQHAGQGRGETDTCLYLLPVAWPLCSLLCWLGSYDSASFCCPSIYIHWEYDQSIHQSHPRTRIQMNDMVSDHLCIY